jgi:hypothetical protein
VAQYFLIEERHLDALSMHVGRLQDGTATVDDLCRIAQSISAVVATCQQMPIGYQPPPGVRLTEQVRRTFETILTALIDGMRDQLRPPFVRAREWMGDATNAYAEPRPDIVRTLRFALSSSGLPPLVSPEDKRDAEDWLTSATAPAALSPKAGGP